MNIEKHQHNNLQYLIKYPENFDKTKKYPVLLFLHGAGTRGRNIELLFQNPYFLLTEKLEDFPFITVAPLCSENTWFDLWNDLKELVITVTKSNFTDVERIYLIGASMGGYATWQLAMSCPEYFAAIVPICGGGMYWNASRLVNIPVWGFHGGKDATVLPQESEKMVNSVNRNGGNAKLTIYPENTHDAWSDTYSNPEVFKWLLSHKNNNIKKVIDKYSDSKKFG